jgi:hypothetical protein
MSKFARRCAALMLAVVLLCMAVPAAFAAEGDTLPAGATTMGGANTTLIPDEEENCLSWLFGSGDTITMPYLNVKGQGLRRNVTLDLEDCLVGITYTELGSIGSYVSDAAAQQAWKAQAVAIHSYLEYHKKYGSSANALVYTPVDQIPSSARSAIRRAVSEVNEVLKKIMLDANIRLVDFKLEFGRLSDGTIILADEISPDTCRFWDATTGAHLDKDLFRRNMGGEADAYQEVMKRLLG